MNRTFAPTLATTFLGCRQAAAWDLARRDEAIRSQMVVSDIRPAQVDGQGDLIIRRGHEHEAGVLAALQKAGQVAIIFDGKPKAKSRERDLTETRQAMEAGVPWIHQATLADDPWFGYADFLRRVEVPSDLGPWSYEPWDAKLTTYAKPAHVLQICLYAQMVGAMQGRMPDRVGLMLGMPAEGCEPGELPGSGRVFREERFRLAEFRYYAERVAGRMIDFVDAAEWDALEAEPCLACGQCHWSERCATSWEAADHLCRTANISRQQMARLREAGVHTQMALASEPLPSVSEPTSRRHGIGVETLERLIHQAKLQKATQAKAGPPPKVPEFELLTPEPGRGLARLPQPDIGDIHFDFEGDPLTPGGLEYLCGVLVDAKCLDGAPAALRKDFVPVGSADIEAQMFRAFWAHDREQEGRTFAELMDFITAHLKRHPAAHLYHYAPYEKSAMRRLASMHALREVELDDLLRQGKLIDLYQVVREGVRVGAESYSIKSLEPLYMTARATEVTGGGDSVVMYHEWRDGGGEDQPILDDIEVYNRDDCVSTVLLRDWLLARAEELGPPADAVLCSPMQADADERAEKRAKETEKQRETRETREQMREDAEALREAFQDRNDPAAAVIGDLVHYHYREDKPAWWSWFDKLDSLSEDLVDDNEAIGAIVADRTCWGVETRTPKGAIAKAQRFRFRGPRQDTKLRGGNNVFIAPGPNGKTVLDGKPFGTIEVVEETADETQVTVIVNPTVKVGDAEVPLPTSLSIITRDIIDKDNIIAAIQSFANDAAAGNDGFPHISGFLRRDRPRLRGRKEGAPVLREGTAGPEAVLRATVDAVRALDRSWLVIQGPPGAGKTYTLSRVIEALNADGKRVGVMSNSHAAIDNVLDGVTKIWGDRSDRFGQKHDSSSRGVKYSCEHDTIVSVSEQKKLREDAQVIGGTAWTFSHPKCPPIDVLVVDEAGQVSLANLVAAATKAKSIVLVGDQMQLPQVVQGSHPGESGLSCLEYALQDARVVPPDRGIFLATTWRMHPDLARFVSETIYEGELEAEAGCANQALRPNKGAHPALKPSGLSFVELPHEGRTQHAPEEVDEVESLFADCLASKVTDRNGKTRGMTLDDILVVAPYNVQVNKLAERLAEGARVGTVDKFQGQEAEVVIVSMTTSDAEHMPRDASFLLSQNRLNVAVSRRPLPRHRRGQPRPPRPRRPLREGDAPRQPAVPRGA